MNARDFDDKDSYLTFRFFSSRTKKYMGNANKSILNCLLWFCQDYICKKKVGMKYGKCSDADIVHSSRTYIDKNPAII